MIKEAAKNYAELHTIETIGHFNKNDCVYSTAFDAFVAGVKWIEK
jgi:hypothetical protein